MGVVYQGRGAAGETVAIKVLHGTDHANADVQDALRVRFEREASVRIDHPNVIRILDAGLTDDGAPYLVMERLWGRALSEVLADAREPIAISGAIAWVTEASEALHAIHAAGVIHRDIKPSNLFLCDDGTIKVVDFGIAHLQNATTLTQTGHMIGTLDYLSPEQAEGSKTLSVTTDVWALGVVLYELLTGQRPFSRDSPMATLVAILMSDPPSIAAVRPGVPSSLESLVSKALCKSPADRWKDPLAFAEALRTFQARTRDAPSSVSQSAAPLMRSGEQRVVAIVMAHGVRDSVQFSQCMHDFGGRPTQCLAGSAMGLFGAQRSSGDELGRACEAALAAAPFATYIAVSAGRALAEEDGLTGVAINDVEAALHRAREADRSGVVVTGSVAEFVPARFERTAVGGDLWQLLKARKAVLQTPQPVRLFGREDELALLERTIARAHDEQTAQSVLFTAEMGGGKSALVNQLTTRSDVDVLLCQSPSAIHRRAFGLWENLLRSLPDAVLEPVLQAWLHPPQGGDLSTLSQTDFRAVRGQLRGALRSWVIARAEQAPTAFVLEDLHRADGESLELLEDLLETIQHTPSVFVLTARGESHESLASLRERVTRSYPLVPLSKRAAQQMTQSLLPRAGSAWVSAIVERAGGNPFFVEQLCLHGTEALPLTIEAAVQSRLDQLPEDAQKLCQALAVLGTPVSVAELRLMGIADPRSLLDTLIGEGTVRRDRDRMSGTHDARRRHYTFSADLFTDVAYESIPPSGRALLHRRAARTLSERLRGNHTSALLAAVARHHELGDEAQQAAEHYLLATAQAARTGDARAVTAHAERALRFEVSQANAYALHMARVEGYRFFSATDPMQEVLDQALEVAASDAQRARVHGELALLSARSRAFADAKGHAERAIALADRSGLVDERVVARGRASLTKSQQGLLEEASKLLEEAQSLAQDVGLETETLLVGWKAHLAAKKGSLKGRIEGFLELHRRYKDAGNLGRAAGAASNLADAYNRVGRYTQAEQALEQAREACQQIGHRVMLGYCLLNLGYARTRLGLLEEARTVIEAARQISRQTEDDQLHDAATLYLARIEARTENPSAAAQLASSLDEPGVSRTVRALALALLGRLAVEQDDIDAALTITKRAFDLCELDPIEEDAAIVYLARLEALSAAGESTEATQRLAQTRIQASLDDIDDPELRASFANIPEHRALLGPDQGV